MVAGPAGAAGSIGPTVRQDPTFHQLRLFLLLAEERHFGRAAARAFVSQPAFSKQFRALEQRLGVELAERDGRSCRLTAQGRELVGYARSALEARARMAELASSSRLTVRLGAIGAETAMPYTRDVLGHLARHHPDVRVEIRNVDFVEQVQALARGAVDAAFLRPPLPPELDGVTLAHEQRVACLPASDPLAERDCVDLAELREHTVVDVPPEVPRMWWDYWTANPRPDGTPVRFGAVCRDLEAALLAVAQGRAMLFLPEAAATLYRRPGLAYVRVRGLPRTTAALVWQTARRDDPAVALVREATCAVVGRQV
ncbi:LysR family transcriptional regulator [Streptomyces sp. NPDC006990]|uniref:LysR family transcriptional regulator n=1 Tax=Streptomyces sp. NPDC006990 TaxID=3154481 RepID=UPI0034566E50